MASIGAQLDEVAPSRAWTADVALALDDAAYAYHPARSNTPKKPPNRLLAPLSRDVAADEYSMLARAA